MIHITRASLRPNVRALLLILIGGFVALSCGGSSTSPSSTGSNATSSLPNITTFLSNPSTTFVMDASGIAQLIAARPFMGSLSSCYNNNLTLYAPVKEAAYTIDMYAPAAGTVSRVDTCSTPSPFHTDQYGVGIDIASYNGKAATLYMSGEPALHSNGFGVTIDQAFPCSGNVAGRDNGFYKPYIFVTQGQTVTAGQRVMQLYVFPQSYYKGLGNTPSGPSVSVSDIQMNKQADQGAFACPNIFSSAVEAQIAAKYPSASMIGLSCNGAPYPTAICNLPTNAENIVGR